MRFKPVLDNLPHRRRARILDYAVTDTGIELTLRVQDFRTYAEMNEKLKREYASEGTMRTAAVKMED